MTRQPDHHAADQQTGKLEFSDQSAQDIVKRLAEAGCTDCALLGGATAHDAFLAAGLVNELWITIEPRLFGSGSPVVSKLQDRSLELRQHERLPDSDSVVLKYRVRG